MKVAVIIGLYNNEEHVRETILSVINQNCKDWKCYIIDNGSSDQSFSRCKDIVGNDDRFVLYKKANEGPSKGRNVGFSLIEDEEYVHFLDGDDRIKPEFLSTMIKYLDGNLDVGLLGCQFDYINSSGKYIGPGYRSRVGPSKLFGFPQKININTPETPFEAFFSATGQGPFAIFRTNVFSLTKGYEETFWSHEDSDIFCQMALIKDVHYLPFRLYEKRIHGNNLTGSKRASYQKFRDKWDYFVPKDTSQNEKILDAIKYYYTRHRPVRDLMIGGKVFIKALISSNRSSQRWGGKLLKDGILNLVNYTNYKNIFHKRKFMEGKQN